MPELKNEEVQDLDNLEGEPEEPKAPPDEWEVRKQEILTEAKRGYDDGYKGLQRVISRREQENRQLAAGNQTLQQQLQQAAQAIAVQREVAQAIVDELGSTLDEEGRMRLERQFQRIGQRYEQAPQQAPAQHAPASQPSGDYESMLAQVRQRTSAMLRKAATVAGVDADDSRLDYGDDNEPVDERFERLSKSIEKARQLDAERKKVARKDREGARMDTEPGVPLGDMPLEQQIAALKKKYKGSSNFDAFLREKAALEAKLTKSRS